MVDLALWDSEICFYERINRILGQNQQASPEGWLKKLVHKRAVVW